MNYKEKAYREKLEKICQKYSFINRSVTSLCNLNNLLRDYTKEEIENLNDYVINILTEDKDIKIKVQKIEELPNDEIYYKVCTNIGTFLIENLETISISNSKDYPTEINLFDFFKSSLLRTKEFSYKLEFKKNHLTNYENSILISYLVCYRFYGLIINKNKTKELFDYVLFSDYLDNTTGIIPLEILNNPKFNHYTRATQHGNNLDRLKNVKEINDNYYPLDKNPYLFFALIINDLIDSKYGLNYIKENISSFKDFLLVDINPGENSSSLKNIFAFILKNDLLKEFSEEKLESLYKKYPYYCYLADRKLFVKISKRIENTSPIIKLKKDEKIMVHIKYEDYHTYSDVPIAFLKRKDSNDSNVFLRNFFYTNEFIYRLYKLYYPKYLKLIKNDAEKNNLEDFLRTLTSYQNLLSLYRNQTFSGHELKELAPFIHYFGEGAEKNLKTALMTLREENLKFYNALVSAKNDRDKFLQTIKCFNLNEKNIINYIVSNKFLDKKQKESLLVIVNNNLNISYSFLDIFLILDEMQSRNLTLIEILNEKDISEKAFYKMYNDAKENNPILYEYIFESLNNNKRKGFIKLIHLGYKILGTELNSLDEYNEKFGNTMEFSKLLQVLKDTELSVKLKDKAASWEQSVDNGKNIGVSVDTKKKTLSLTPTKKTAKQNQ